MQIAILALFLVAGTFCGTLALPFGQSRIVGGSVAPNDEFLYQVGLSVTKSGSLYWCGGSLIAPNYVLTAAHCMAGASSVLVITGHHNIADMSSLSGNVFVSSNAYTIHPEYDAKITKNDLALIKLPKDLVLNDRVQTIDLAPSTMDESYLEGRTATASGWGKISDSYDGITDNLQFVDITIMNQDACAMVYASGLVNPTNICSDGTDLKATCNGDSGGPLAYTVNGVTYLVGLTSFGASSGCQQGYPTAFTRVTSYLDWISTETGLTFESPEMSCY